MKFNKGIVILAILLGAVTLLAVISPFLLETWDFLRKEPSVEITPKNCYAETLHVVADIDYQPYSFLDENGVYSGHDVELAAELANRLGMNLDLQLLSWDRALARVQTGRADMIMGAESIYKPDTRIGMSMSVPIVDDPFVVFSKQKASDISVLYGKKIAVIAQSGASYILDAYHLSAYCTPYPSYTDAFLSVAKGENQYVIVRYSVGKRICRTLNLKQIMPTGISIFENSLCFGINENEPELKQRIDEQLVGMIADRTLEKLHSKWLGNYVNIQSLYDYLRQNIWIILVYCLTVVSILLAYTIISSYVTHRKEARLIQLAEKDSLTGILNRATAESWISSVLKQNQTQHHALMIIDIDNFKDVNDILGHSQGDVVLKELAETLRDIFRESDIIGRLGGDEFFALMRGVSNIQAAVKKAEQVCQVLQVTYTKNKSCCAISASVGVAMFPKDGADFQTLYERADTALYLSKKRGKNQYTLYHEN